MPTNLTFRTGLTGDWQTLIYALQSTRDNLYDTIKTVEDEDEQNVLYDHIERIDGMLPLFEKQLGEYLDEATASVDPSLFIPEEQAVASVS